MSDYLHHLAARTLGRTVLIQPRLASPFEPPQMANGVGLGRGLAVEQPDVNPSYDEPEKGAAIPDHPPSPHPATSKVVGAKHRPFSAATEPVRDVLQPIEPNPSGPSLSFRATLPPRPGDSKPDAASSEPATAGAGWGTEQVSVPTVEPVVAGPVERQSSTQTPSRLRVPLTARPFEDKPDGSSSQPVPTLAGTGTHHEHGVSLESAGALLPRRQESRQSLQEQPRPDRKFHEEQTDAKAPTNPGEAERWRVMGPLARQVYHDRITSPVEPRQGGQPLIGPPRIQEANLRNVRSIVGQPKVRSSTKVGSLVPPQADESLARSPTIHVTIGRVEVRATPPPASPSRTQRPAPSVMNLDEYLRRRAGGGGQ